MANVIHDLLLADDNIFSVLGADALPPGQKNAMLEQMTDLIQKRVLLRLMESLTEADAAQIERLGDTAEAIISFMSKKTDMNKVLGEEVASLKIEMAAVARSGLNA